MCGLCVSLLPQEALTAQHAETLAALQSAHGKSVVEQVTMRRERDTVAVEVAVVRSELAVAVSERDMWKTEHRTVTAQLRATNSELQAAQTMIQQLHAEMVWCVLLQTCDCVVACACCFA